MEIKEIRENLGWTQKEFADYFNIPLGTIHNWEQGLRKPPEYVVAMVKRLLKAEQLVKNLR